MSNFIRLVCLVPMLLAVADASTLNLGVLSFDNLLPSGPSSTGVNVFDISDLTGNPATGGFALPPDFPAFTPVSFLNSTIMLMGPKINQTINLGTIGIGPLAAPGALQFASNVVFSSAVFSATLNGSQIGLSNGSMFLAGPAITAVLTPTSGSSLIAGASFAVITASNAPSSVPETSTFGHLIAGLGVLAGVRFSRMRFLRSLCEGKE